MSAATTLLPPQAGYTDEPIFRLSVDQYHDLIERGKLTLADPVELIEGMLVFKMPKYRPHEVATGSITDVFTPILPKGWHLRTQAPVTLRDGEPEPDGAIVRGQRRDYGHRHPYPNDIELLIEVADSTRERDRTMKLRSYARAGIVCYWIVNLVDRQIEVYTQPDSTAEVPTYPAPAVYKPGDSVPFQIGDQLIGSIPVADILPA